MTSVPGGEWTTAGLRRVPTFGGAVVAGIGLLVLSGWVFGLDALKNQLPGLATMKGNTALCFFLAGLALMLQGRRRLRLGCAGLVCAVAGATLAEYISGVNFGLDQLLFRDTPDPHTVYAGRMVEATALGFLLSSTSLLLLGAQGRAWRQTQQALAVGAGLIGMVAVLGYLYGVAELYRFAGYSSMALHTAGSFALLALGLLFSGRDGLAELLGHPTPGAQLARRLLPAALLVPVLIGLLCLAGLRHGLYGPGMDTANFALATILSLSALVLWAARSLNRADETRRATETQLHNQAELIDQADEALVIRELGGAIRSWNRGAETLYGWSASEAVGQRGHVLLRMEGALLEQIDAQLEQTGRWEGELVHTTRDGRRVLVECRQTAVRAADGRLLVLKSDRDVTSRRQAEEQLRLLSTALEAAANGIAITDRSGAIQWVNPAFATLTGYSREEAQGQNPRVLKSGQHAPEFYREIWATILRGQPWHGHLVNRRKDGTLFDEEMTITPVRAGGGDITHFVAVKQDVTQRKRAEEQIKQSEARLRAVLDQAPCGITIREVPSGRMLLSNEQAGRILGETAPGLDQVVRYGGVHPDGTLYRREDYALVRAAEQGETVRGEEFTFHRADGEWLTLSVSAAPIRGLDGRIIAAVAVFDDITARKRTESRLRRFYETDLFAILYWKIDGGVVDVNDRFLKMTGYSREDIRTGLLNWAKITPPEFQALDEDARRQVRETGIHLPYEKQFIRKDGTRVWGLFSAAAYEDDRTQGVSFILDITERKQAEEALFKATEDLKRSNRDLEQFAYVASHDLQEPLRAVGGYVKLLRRRFPDTIDPKALEYIVGAAEGAERMEQLITDLLAFSRVGTKGGQFLPTDLNAVLDNALQNLQTAIRTSEAKVTRDALPLLPVDATQIMQLLQNLIGNAIKFRGERPPVIHVGAQKQAGRWILSVRDNGIGIEPQYFERIFQIFQRLHTRKHYPGTGIGLAICKKIVERHGGEIWVESAPGQGSHFYFSIPETRTQSDPAHD